MCACVGVGGGEGGVGGGVRCVRNKNCQRTLHYKRTKMQSERLLLSIFLTIDGQTSSIRHLVNLWHLLKKEKKRKKEAFSKQHIYLQILLYGQ